MGAFITSIYHRAVDLNIFARMVMSIGNEGIAGMIVSGLNSSTRE